MCLLKELYKGHVYYEIECKHYADFEDEITDKKF